VAELTKLASAKRLCTGDYTEVSRCLKKLVGDVNLAVAVEAVQAIGNLASGLRKDFTAGARLLLPVLLDKLKEKKQVMVEALTLTLNELHKNGCILLTEVVEGKFFQAF
jgi:cytoskeleton-associated protein 5